MRNDKDYEKEFGKPAPKEHIAQYHGDSNEASAFVGWIVSHGKCPAFTDRMVNGKPKPGMVFCPTCGVEILYPSHCEW